MVLRFKRPLVISKLLLQMQSWDLFQYFRCFVWSPLKTQILFECGTSLVLLVIFFSVGNVFEYFELQWDHPQTRHSSALIAWTWREKAYSPVPRAENPVAELTPSWAASGSREGTVPEGPLGTSSFSNRVASVTLCSEVSVFTPGEVNPGGRSLTVQPSHTHSHLPRR